MNNPLAEEAQRLANKSGFEPSGEFQVQKKSEKGPWTGKVVVITLKFYGLDEYKDAIKWAIENGFEPHEPAQQPNISKMRPTDLVGEAPVCPIHQRPMRAGRKPGTWYCSQRVGGGYCDQRR